MGFNSGFKGLISLASFFIPLPLIDSIMDVLCNRGNKDVLRITIPVTSLLSVRKYYEFI